MIEQKPKKPYFVFPDIAPYKEFSFEKLTSENFHQLCLLFQADKCVFTDERFKDCEEAEKYAQHLEQYGAYSPKHGGQDWLYLWKNQYAGILHLYDLSLETFNENNRRCWIGFAATPAIRNKGITKKAVQYFIQYIQKNYPFIKYIHAMTLKENAASKALLKSVGFCEDDTERMSKKYSFYLITLTSTLICYSKYH